MVTLRNALLTLACALLYTPAGAEAKTLFVRPTGNDSSDGASWSTAKATPQDAMSVAVAGDEIWVAAGTYTTHLFVKLGVALYGGFNGTETARAQRNWTTNVTVLDGAGSGAILFMQQGYSPPQIIDGFTLTHGERAVHVLDAAPVLRNNRITDNRSAWGPGVAGARARPRIIDNFISNNYSVGAGAIAFADSEVYVAGNTLTGNTASGTAGGDPFAADELASQNFRLSVAGGPSAPVVPEPVSLALFVPAVAALALMRRRRQPAVGG